MNFLAHAHLSFYDDSLLLGNMIADAVKGKAFFSYGGDIRQGLYLHRKIDAFTDGHPIVRHSKRLIYDDLGRYSGIVVDIYYDHFLALCWLDFSTIELDVFTSRVYQILGKNWIILPAKIRRILPYMVAQNWLHSYANPNELKRVFEGMDRRTANQSGMRYAMGPLREYYDMLKADFMDFYPQLQKFVMNERVNDTICFSKRTKGAF